MNKIEFKGAEGQTLSARLDKPGGQIRGYALFAHCFTCGKDIKGATAIAKALAAEGIAVLRFDFTGLGASEGEFANTNFTSNIQDLLAASRYMEEELEAPQLLIGHSLGGTAVLAAAAELPSVRAIATIGAPADTEHVTQHFSGKEEEILEDGEAEVKLAGRSFTIKKQFIDDIRAQNMKAKIADLKKALLILHSPLDEIVSIDNASEIFLAAKHPKSFVSLDEADHLLSRKHDARYAASVIAGWASRYIYTDASEDNDPPAKGIVRIETTGEGKFQNSVQVGAHKMLADEPESYGGDETGPTPYDYLAIALGTCKSMTIRMYADHKKLPLEGVKVDVKHDKIHAKDCEDCEDKDGKVDQFECQITVYGDDLNDDQRKRLVEISEKCPVHKTLQNQVVVRTRLSK